MTGFLALAIYGSIWHFDSTVQGSLFIFRIRMKLENVLKGWFRDLCYQKRIFQKEEKLTYESILCKKITKFQKNLMSEI